MLCKRKVLLHRGVKIKYLLPAKEGGALTFLNIDAREAPRKGNISSNARIANGCDFCGFLL
jgi:hypothetical protein